MAKGLPDRLGVNTVEVIVNMCEDSKESHCAVRIIIADRDNLRQSSGRGP